MCNTSMQLYDQDYTVLYSNNKEYRDCMRHLFKMKPNTSNIDLDEETLDEQNYDNSRAIVLLDYIYSITKDNPQFQELYAYGAATMFSQDPEIGLTILFSYDYFYFFHPCLCNFIKVPQQMNEKNEYYLKIKQRIMPSKNNI